MRKRSTPLNITKFEQAKQKFSETLISEKNKWIRTKLEKLNVMDSKTFWKNYKKTIVGGSKEYLGNLEERGVLLTTHDEKEEVLFNTFFSRAKLWM